MTDVHILSTLLSQQPQANKAFIFRNKRILKVHYSNTFTIFIQTHKITKNNNNNIDLNLFHLQQRFLKLS